MAQAVQEMSLDDFTMEAPKAVPVLDPEQLKEKVGAKNADGKVQTFSKIEQSVISSLDNQVEQLVKDLMSAPIHSDEMKDLTSAINNMGSAEVSKTAQMSNRMLQRPLRSMRQNDFGDGKSIASSLKSLRSKITELDPTKRDALFSKNKIFGMKIPFGLGNRVDSYMQEFKSSEYQLNDIVKSLLNGKDELIEDNAMIQVERENMAELMGRLEQYAYIMKKLYEKVEKKLPEIEADDKLKASDIRQEILYPLGKKSMAIYQHLAVCMQGYMSLQVIKSNNEELIRGVGNAIDTTLTALRTAVMVSEALGSQKLVLDQVTFVNDMTNQLIEQNANRLGTQGLEIQKQASESSVNAEVLAKSFQQIFKAMDAMDSYREQALPNMKKTVASLEQSVTQAKEYLQKNRQERIGNFSEEILKEESPEEQKTVKVRL
jgi:uncharacterized protein YaaN involved in tellurite resistance